MKRTIKIQRLLALLALFFCLCASAQETYRFAERDTCSLYLDIFRPDSSAQTTFKGINKPAVMFLFGGGFVGGSRSDANARRWFSRLTANGYTVVAIDYRLGMKGHKMGKGLRGAVFRNRLGWRTFSLPYRIWQHIPNYTFLPTIL